MSVQLKTVLMRFSSMVLKTNGWEIMHGRGHNISRHIKYVFIYLWHFVLIICQHFLRLRKAPRLRSRDFRQAHTIKLGTDVVFLTLRVHHTTQSNFKTVIHRHQLTRPLIDSFLQGNDNYLRCREISRPKIHYLYV